MRPHLYATSHVGPLDHGNSHAQILLDENHVAWVVKSLASAQQGPTRGRALFNDYVATRVAELLNLPVPQVSVILVEDVLLDAFPTLRTQAFGTFTPGFHLAIRYHQGVTLRDFRSAGLSSLADRRVVNKLAANAVVTFDTWTCNPDRAVETDLGLYENEGNLLFETSRPGELRLMMLDQGQAFAGDWHDQPDGNPFSRLGAWPLRLMGHLNLFVRGRWLDLESCLEYVSHIQHVPLVDLRSIVHEVPWAWREGISEAEIEELLLYLIRRAAHLEKPMYQELTALPERMHARRRLT
ncbi:hypothetical protein DAETH_33190 (plasmid) [Deinococcus aetherius]|uniref:HipA-like kinase domain-containing protein n=1 Tax=Deinococcus aetherius TaxID=200252 RepID=A0ABN6RKJ3_9DEIO|nr:HipA family kinase [Deinococcus aetherius]BDP43350.1 hypothetical protein DAETH_33190 [Deinococcus aetherius]